MATAPPARPRTLQVSSSESLNDRLEGRIDIIYDEAALAQIKSGKLKVRGVISPARHVNRHDCPEGV